MVLLLRLVILLDQSNITVLLALLLRAPSCASGAALPDGASAFRGGGKLFRSASRAAQDEKQQRDDSAQHKGNSNVILVVLH